MDLYQAIGYAGSVLVAVSLMMKNILYLRRVNLLGSSTFAAYGFLVGAYPVFLLNSFIALVDIYYLIEMYKRKDYFSLMPVLDNRHQYLNKFLDYYYKDIKKFFPDFTQNDLIGANCFFILRNLMPVGIFIFKEISKNQIKVVLDYAIPDYRDMKNAEFVYFAESNFIKAKGYSQIVAETKVKAHQKYLFHLGFKQDKQNANLFIKTL